MTTITPGSTTVGQQHPTMLARAVGPALARLALRRGPDQQQPAARGANMLEARSYRPGYLGTCKSSVPRAAPLAASGPKPPTLQPVSQDLSQLKTDRASPPNEQNVVVVLSTAPAAEAIELARFVVERSLAACVNLMPGVRSIYRWQGAVCDEEETVLLVKTTRERLAQLELLYVERHSYTTPEFVVLDAAGHAPYLEWVREQVGLSVDN